MMMWADRLLDGRATGYGPWEGSTNGTAAALNRIPTDVILCDWHYGKRTEYPSIPLFLKKGFRVWPAGWDKTDATIALVQFARRHRQPRLLGHLATTWGKVSLEALPEFPPLGAALKAWKDQEE